MISIKNVSKTYKVRQTKSSSIKEFLPLLLQFKLGKKQEIKAINNISLKIKRGETFGIIGRNGSGKSTLIHLMMKSIMPDKGGKIKTNGSMMRLALGMGVDPNLSARDNIYVNGSIIGLSFKRIGSLFDNIITFANLEGFVDTPVKFYSKGMKQRLLFSIAIHADAEIFLLDEFFGGVGDEDFKRKSNIAFEKRILEGRTIIIVSHSMHIVKKFCSRTLWLENGEIKSIGNTNQVVKEYRLSFQNEKD